MSGNSVMPSLDKIMNAVNSDLIDSHKNQVQNSDTKSVDRNELIFDAEKWYLQDYPKKVNIKTLDIDEPVSHVSDNKTPEKSGMSQGNVILLAIASIVLIGFCLYLFLQ